MRTGSIRFACEATISGCGLLSAQRAATLACHVDACGGRTHTQAGVCGVPHCAAAQAFGCVCGCSACVPSQLDRRSCRALWVPYPCSVIRSVRCHLFTNHQTADNPMTCLVSCAYIVYVKLAFVCNALTKAHGLRCVKTLELRMSASKEKRLPYSASAKCLHIHLHIRTHTHSLTHIELQRHER